MNISNTTNPSSQPLERKKTPAPNLVFNNPENIETKDKMGWFDPNEFQEYKVETSEMSGTGSISFDTDKVVQPSVISEMFGGSDKWISIKPSNVAEQVVNTASTAINVTKDLASASIDAGLDIFNKMTGLDQKTERTEVSQDPSKIDPATAKKQEEVEKYSIIKEANEVLDKAQADYRGKELFEKAVMSKKAEIAELANLQGNYRDVLDDNGDVRKDLETSVAQARKKIMEDQQADKSPVISASKKGGQGNLEANKANETSGGNSNAQNAVG